MKSKNLTTYCITKGENDSLIKELNLKIIVGGAINKKFDFPDNWILDNSGHNISYKNQNFGTLTSLYWIWKNELDKYNDESWIAISHYRRFWLKENHEGIISPDNLNSNILREIPDKYLNFDAFVAKPQNLTGYKFSKLFRKAKKNIINKPSILFNKKNHNIKLHFDMFHLYCGLEKAASVMDNSQKNDFLNYINNETELFSPFSIFILKKDKFKKLCESTFKWIDDCENIFDTEKLFGYGQIRIFDFLAERYFSFWIKENTNYKNWPFVFIDPRINNNSIIQ
tara:strand:+ start:293 stop:1141 length:849 start_codon:yes stop_codon:yes gene_type:complete